MSRKELEYLGSQRPSLSTNPLLIAPQLGKPRRRCFTLPPADFTYGMRTVCFDGGAAEALSIWHAHSKKGRIKEDIPEKDYITLNILAAQSGLTTAQEQSQFRACNDIRRRDKDKDIKKSHPAKDMVYGIQTRPSTPIFDLLENKYQERWLLERKDAEKKARDDIRQRKLQGKVYETNASLLRRYSEPVDPPPLWKMKRFTKIPATLNTFPSEKDRERAFAHYVSDSIAREGTIGQGIYTT